MGQAKRRKDLGIVSKRQRFVHLMRLLTKYNDQEIRKLAGHRNLK